MRRARAKPARKRRQPARSKSSRTHKPIAESMPSGFTMGVYPAQDLLTFEKVLELNAWVYAAVMRLAAATSSVPFRLVKSGTDEDFDGKKADEIREVLERVNDYQSSYDFREACVMHLGVTGEVTVEKARGAGGRGQTRELHVLNPAYMRPVPDRTGKRWIQSWIFDFPGKEPVQLDAEDVIYCRYHHPLDPYRGLSPLCSIRAEVSGDIAAATYNKALISKGMRPGGLLIPKDFDLDDNEAKRLASAIKQQIASFDRAGNLLVIPMGFEFKQDSISPRDMDFLGSRKFTREAVAAALGVAPMMIQNFDSATYANSEQQLKAFWDYQGIPLLQKLFGAFNEHWIHREYGAEISLAPDLVAIEAQIDSEKSRVDNAQKKLNGGIITINEARAELGYPPLPDGDKLLIQGALVPMSPDEIQNPLSEPIGITDELGPPPPDEDDEPDEGAPPRDGGTQDARDEEGSVIAERRAQLFGHNGHARNGHSWKGPSAEERQVIKRLHAKGLRDARRRVRAATAGALHGMLSRVQARLRRFSAVPQAADLLPDPLAETKLLLKAIAPALLEVIRETGETVLRRVGFQRERERRWRPAAGAHHLKADAAVSFTLNNPAIRNYFEKHLFQHLYRVSQSCLAQLEVVIQEHRASEAAGQGVSELAARLRDLPIFGGKRADTIAHTETIAAIGTASNEAFVAAGTPRKSWLSTGRNTRASHAQAEIETSANPIPTDQPFTLSEPDRGTTQCRYPGDPLAPGWAAINCACTMVPEAAADDDIATAHARWYARKCIEESKGAVLV